MSVVERKSDGTGSRFGPVFLLLAAMWLFEAFDTLWPRDLDQYGIHPRQLHGLIGIPLAPFLHVGFQHLLANTVPFLVLGMIIAARVGRDDYLRASVAIVLIGGIGVWLIAPADSVTIGASGLVFGYLTFLLSCGFLTRRFMDIAIGVITMIIYGPLLLGAFPFAVPPGVSWQSHLTGAAAGVLAARVIVRT